MKRFFGGLVLLAACGSVPDNTHPPDAPHEDAAPPMDGPDIDAAPPPPRCDPSKPFGTPTKVDALDIANANDMHVALSQDELTLVFASDRAGGQGLFDIYTSTRGSQAAPWSAPTPLTLNTPGDETRPTLSADQLSLFATYRPTPNSSYLVERATRGSTSEAFGPLSSVNIVNAVAGNYDPFVTPDLSAIYFTSNRNSGTNGEDIYVATGNASGFSTPTPVVGTSLDTVDDETNPVVTPDQLNLYFRSDRGGANQLDVWYASRASMATGFGTPVNLSAVNTTASETPAWISADNCVLYFARTVGTTAAFYDIFVVEKPL
ncbi:MAG TPA: hypothetical protein VGM39_14025 [Kofleriaceae bacterium]